MPRYREYGTNADRQRAYRQRQRESQPTPAQSGFKTRCKKLRDRVIRGVDACIEAQAKLKRSLTEAEVVELTGFKDVKKFLRYCHFIPWVEITHPKPKRNAVGTMAKGCPDCHGDLDVVRKDFPLPVSLLVDLGFPEPPEPEWPDIIVPDMEVAICPRCQTEAPRITCVEELQQALSKALVYVRKPAET
jgi:hypothetical protein